MKYSKIFTAVGALCGLTSTSISLSSNPPIYEIIRGEYEDKIRRYSAPQKIFSVFAKMDQHKRCTMSLGDLLKAVCFYNYSQSDSQKISNYRPSHIIKLMGKQGNYEVYDYSNFVRFIFTQKEVFQQFFVAKGIKNVTKQSFLELLIQKVCQDSDGFIRQPLYIQSRQFSTSKEDYYNTCKRMTESMFADKKSYSLDELSSFRNEIMRQLYQYQYKMFKTQNVSIDGVDFARSIVKYAQNNHKRKFLRKIFWIEQRIKGLKINQKQYVNFHMHFQLNQKAIQAKVNEKGAVNRKQLKSILGLTSDNISSQQSDILFELLDADNSDFLQKKQILGVVSMLTRSFKTKPGQITLGQLARQRLNKFLNKSKQILDIVLQQ